MANLGGHDRRNPQIKVVATLPPQVEQGSPDPETPVCLICKEPGTWQSPAGYWACEDCRRIVNNLAGPPEGLQPVDLWALMMGNPPEQEWCVEPILPAGKLCGIVSKRGDGKSLLLLDLAAAKATGRPALTQDTAEPVHVIYLDMEMGPEDLYDRLTDLGYTPDQPDFATLERFLHYYQLVKLPPLDTPEGGKALEDLVEWHDASLVVIDTVSRVVSGAENEAEPYRNLFRWTETMLKRRRVTLARLDHLGKDKEKGSRGSSAKEDPLDVVWLLTINPFGQTELALTKGRQATLPRLVTIHKEETGATFRHVIHEEPAPDWMIEIVDRLNRLEVSPDLSLNQTMKVLKAAGQGSHRNKVSMAMRFRRARKGGSAKPGTTQNAQIGTGSGTTRNHPVETLVNVELLGGTTSGTSSEPVVPVGVPSIGRNHPATQPKLEESAIEEDDFEPDPDDLIDLDEDD